MSHGLGNANEASQDLFVILCIKRLVVHRLVEDEAQEYRDVRGAPQEPLGGCASSQSLTSNVIDEEACVLKCE